jgi:hypothetical protein
MGRWLDRGRTRRGLRAEDTRFDHLAGAVAPQTTLARNDQTTKVPSPPADPFRRWRWTNAEQLTAGDLARGRDPGGFSAAHGRALAYPEQQRGACSWCVPVEPEREPEYWASYWRRFKERR